MATAALKPQLNEAVNGAQPGFPQLNEAVLVRRPEAFRTASEPKSSNGAFRPTTRWLGLNGSSRFLTVGVEILDGVVATIYEPVPVLADRRARGPPCGIDGREPGHDRTAIASVHVVEDATPSIQVPLMTCELQAHTGTLG